MAELGRPPWIPTEKQIEEAGILHGQGMTLEQIADYFGISYQTLNERKKEIPDFADAFKRGKGQANAYVTGKLMNHIENGNLTAAIFYMKCQMGWKEAQVLEHQGKDGGAIKVETELKLNAQSLLSQAMDVITKDKEKLNDEISGEPNV